MELTKEGAPDQTAIGESTTYDRLVGQTIGANFLLIKRLGAGAMGRVFQAEQLSLGKMVAVKVMRSELMNEPNLIQRFELEARAASALNHPNLIQILDFGRDRDFLFIAMELLAGIDLANLLKREKTLALERAVRIIDQVLSGLDEAHAHGIVHRDLKPENIILVPRREDPDFVKIYDFGVAKAIGGERPDLTVAGLVFGTPDYMSPEQARGGHVDGRADLYAVATILYELLVGEIPFRADTPADVMGRQLRDQPAPPSSHPNVFIPAALEALILRGLAKRAEDRPQTAAAFQAELHEALAGIVDHWPSQSARSNSVNRAPTPSWRTAAALGSGPVAARQRRPVILAMGGTLMLLAIGGAGAYWLTNGWVARLLPRRAAVPALPATPRTAARSAARPPLARHLAPDDEASADDEPEGLPPTSRPEADGPDYGRPPGRSPAARPKRPAARARATRSSAPTAPHPPSAPATDGQPGRAPGSPPTVTAPAPILPGDEPP